MKQWHPRNLQRMLFSLLIPVTLVEGVMSFIKGDQELTCRDYEKRNIRYKKTEKEMDITSIEFI